MRWPWTRRKPAIELPKTTHWYVAYAYSENGRPVVGTQIYKIHASFFAMLDVVNCLEETLKTKVSILGALQVEEKSVPLLQAYFKEQNKRWAAVPDKVVEALKRQREEQTRPKVKLTPISGGKDD